MIPNSIKWRLQLWYGLILVLVLAGFGVTAYQMARNRQFNRIDQELHRRFNALAEALRRPPRGPVQGRLPPPGSPSDDLRAPPGQMPNNRPFANDLRPNEKFSLPARAIGFFGTNDPNNFFFRISLVTDRGDQEIARSDNYPKLSAPDPVVEFDHTYDQINHVDFPPRKQPNPPRAMDFQDNRLIREFSPSGEFIEVGCSLAPELKELRRTALNLTAAGGLILLVGLAGGWWFVGRALRPIAAISATATKIAAGDLAQRVNVAEAESELGQLAAVLNSTFARLETAFAQQKQFAADAAHELRTPVSVMLTQTQTALNRERDAATYKQTVEACQRAAQRMRRLIESLLELARFDAGQEVLKRRQFDFSKTVADCAESVQPLAVERRVKIFVAAEPLEIMGDAERLTQVLTNLLTNAIQYSQPDGEVRVKLESENALAVLTVSDTGQGITAENLPRVFGRFFRADDSRTGAGNAGLGLAIAKAIVEAHGGTIEAASGIDSGTTFTVRLPAGV